jgi:uncharacterized protein
LKTSLAPLELGFIGTLMKSKIILIGLVIILLGILAYNHYSVQDTLLTAARDGKLAVTKELLKKSNKGIEDKDDRGRTPLMLSAISGDAKITKMLIEAGANINAKDNVGLNAIQIAIGFIRPDVIGVLVDAGGDPNSSLPNSRATALVVAANKRDKQLAKKLLAAKADVNAKTRSGKTPLTYALELGEEEIAGMFLDAGAGIEESKKDENILSRIAFNGHANIIRLLLERGLVQQGVDGGLHEALGYVAADGHLDLVEKFLDTGKVEINKPNDNGNTPLLLALKGGKAITISKLIDAKANVNWFNKAGRNALMITTSNPSIEIIRLFIGSGVKVNATDLDGKTALMCLASYRCPNTANVAEMLIDAKANVNAQDVDGWTTLMYAARDGNPEIAEILIKAGANLSLKTKDGRTAQAIAEQRKHEDILALLKREKH